MIQTDSIGYSLKNRLTLVELGGTNQIRLKPTRASGFFTGHERFDFTSYQCQEICELRSAGEGKKCTIFIGKHIQIRYIVQTENPTTKISEMISKVSMSGSGVVRMTGGL